MLENRTKILLGRRINRIDHAILVHLSQREMSTLSEMHQLFPELKREKVEYSLKILSRHGFIEVGSAKRAVKQKRQRQWWHGRVRKPTFDIVREMYTYKSLIGSVPPLNELENFKNDLPPELSKSAIENAVTELVSSGKSATVTSVCRLLKHGRLDRVSVAKRFRDITIEMLDDMVNDGVITEVPIGFKHWKKYVPRDWPTKTKLHLANERFTLPEESDIFSS